MFDRLIARYIDSFNERDAGRRRGIVDAIYTEDATYTDPHVSISGRGAIDAFAADAQRRMPEAVFSLAGPIDAHHDQARFSWEVRLRPGAEVFAVGFDVVAIADGRIRRVFGFIDRGREHAMREAVGRYLDAWSETDAAARKAALGGVFTSDGTYADPQIVARGVDAIDGYVAAVQRQFPGVAFVLGDRFDAHHEQARFTWHAMAPGRADPVAIGFDVAVFDGGRMRDVLGFIDRAPA